MALVAWLDVICHSSHGQWHRRYRLTPERQATCAIAGITGGPLVRSLEEQGSANDTACANKNRRAARCAAAESCAIMRAYVSPLAAARRQCRNVVGSDSEP